MLIQQVSSLTGISKKTLYYYEAMGLIHPKTLTNGYRDFSDDDLKLLETILLLRKIDMSIADIKIYLSTTENKKEQLLVRQLQTLKNRDTMLNYQIHLCNRLLHQDINTVLSHKKKQQNYTLPKIPFCLGTSTTPITSLLILISQIISISIFLYLMLLPITTWFIKENNGSLPFYFFVPIGIILFVTIFFFAFPQPKYEFRKEGIRYFNNRHDRSGIIPYEDILEVEVRWIRDAIMIENWTPVKIFIFFRITNRPAIIMDFTAFSGTYSEIPLILGIMEEYFIPIYDPDKIGATLQKNHDINDYLYGIYQKQTGIEETEKN